MTLPLQGMMFLEYLNKINTFCNNF